MELLLLSNGKANEFPGLLGWARDRVQSLLARKQVKRILLIPYAVIRSDWDARARELTESLGVDAISIHHFDDPVDAINRAGSTQPAAIQKALRETNLPADQLLMPWTGVKFDEKGQNIGVRAILQQLQGGSYSTIYPFDLALKEPIYPIPAWSKR